MVLAYKALAMVCRCVNRIKVISRAHTRHVFLFHFEMYYFGQEREIPPLEVDAKTRTTNS